MRKIYQKYFEIPEENKGIMGERVFFARLAVTIACIVLCMSAMGFSAYAFFTANVSSNMNQIQAANFDLEIQIEAQTGTSSASYESEGTYKLQAGSIYKFKLVKSGNASTGYCKIVLTPNDVTSKETSEVVFYTHQLGKVEGQAEPVNIREITIKVGVATTVKFVPCWGTYSGEGVSEVTYAMDAVKSTTNVQSEIPSEPSETPSTTVIEPTTSTETTTPAETTNTSENIVRSTEEKKDEASSNETESDKVKSDELTEDITTSTNTTE